MWPPGSLWPPSSSVISSALPSGLFHLVNYLQSQQVSPACFISEDWLGRAVIILQSVREMKASLGKDGVIRDSEQQDCITLALKWAAAALSSLESYTENGSPVLDAELAQAGIIISHYVSQSSRKDLQCPSFCSRSIPSEQNLRVSGSEEEQHVRQLCIVTEPEGCGSVIATSVCRVTKSAGPCLDSVVAPS